MLFGLRISPLIAAGIVTLAFATPAFVILESGVIDEDVGTLVFSICSLLLFGAGVFRALTARARTNRIVGDWMQDASALNVGASVPTFESRTGMPPLLLFGVSAPRVLVSQAAVAVLNPEELRLAVQHEMVHLHSRDNLKKLILHCCPFPGMGSLERAWQEAAELAADEAAISSRHEALDLASALLKVSDLVPVQAPPAFTTGLVNVSMSVNVRVERLLAWNEEGDHGADLRWRHFLPPSIATAGYAAINYSHALMLTHRLTEWFVH